MSERTTMFLGALTSILLLIIMAGFSVMLFVNPPARAESGVTGLRQVTVVGHGEIKGKPDTAQVQIGVENEAATTKEALAQNSAQVAVIIEQLKKLGIAEKDMQTSNFSISAKYDKDGRQVTGYNVSNSVSVKIRQLDKAGALLDQVVQAGANRIYGINFSVDDPSALLNQARDKALADAKAKAGQLAQGAGAKLGQVLVLTENIGEAPVPRFAAGAMLKNADGVSEVPLQAGEQTFSLQIQATFELR